MQIAQVVGSVYPSIDEIEFVRGKRRRTLVETWELLPHSKDSRYKLSIPQVIDVVEHYIEDWKALKRRYNIADEIQLHKIAGLVAGTIMRYRPILFLADAVETESDLYANEKLAIFHGLAICSEMSKSPLDGFINNPRFDRWLNDFIFLLRKRNYTSESLMLVFQTISLQAFPEGLLI